MTVPPSFLRVDSNELPKDGAQAVRQAVAEIAEGAHACCLSAHALQDTDAREVLNALADTSQARLVELDRNVLGDASARLLKQALFNQENRLKILDLSVNIVGDQGAFALAEGVGYSKTLQELNLSFNQLSGVGANHIAKALQYNSSLRSLTLNGNGVGDAGAEALAGVLPNNGTLRILNIREGKIGDAGARCLAQSLSLPTATLTDLALGNNQVGDDGGVCLAEMLKVNSVMKELHIDHNAMTDTASVALADAIPSNDSLLMLWLVRNPISKSSVDLFANALHKNSKLRRLGFTSKDRIEQSTIDIITDLRQKRLKQDSEAASRELGLFSEPPNSTLETADAETLGAQPPTPPPTSQSATYDLSHNPLPLPELPDELPITARGRNDERPVATRGRDFKRAASPPVTPPPVGGLDGAAGEPAPPRGVSATGASSPGMGSLRPARTLLEAPAAGAQPSPKGGMSLLTIPSVGLVPAVSLTSPRDGGPATARSMASPRSDLGSARLSPMASARMSPRSPRDVERPDDQTLADIAFFDDEMFEIDVPAMINETGQAPGIGEDFMSTF